MKPVTRARIAGGIAGVAGIGLLVAGQWGPGLGALTAGAAALVLVTERGVPDGLPDASAAGALAAVSELTRSLNLHGRGIVLPGTLPDRESRLFVPVEDTSIAEMGHLDSHATLQREPIGALGVLITPPGAALEIAWRDTNGLPQGLGAEEAAQHIRQSFAHLALGTRVSVARAGEAAQARVRITYEPNAYADACRRSREEQAPWHTQGGCPACSLAALLVARAHTAPVRLRDAGADGERVYLELEVGGRSQA